MEALKDTQACYQGTAMGSSVGGPPNLIHSSVVTATLERSLDGDSSQDKEGLYPTEQNVSWTNPNVTETCSGTVRLPEGGPIGSLGKCPHS